jgi:hypothetical protein
MDLAVSLHCITPDSNPVLSDAVFNLANAASAPPTASYRNTEPGRENIALASALFSRIRGICVKCDAAREFGYLVEPAAW